jgi:hypothetical protein
MGAERDRVADFGAVMFRGAAVSAGRPFRAFALAASGDAGR